MSNPGPAVSTSTNTQTVTGGSAGAVVGTVSGPTTFAGSNFVAASTLTDVASVIAYLHTLGLAT
jgi:outer membrane lipoprotein SlyB